MKPASLWMTRAIFAAALIAFGTLSTSAFADAEIPRIRPVLTVIGGKIVHDAGVLQVR
jgi:hypothetical protein